MNKDTHDELFFADEDSAETPQSALSPWKIMIVDDEAEVHEITKMALNSFMYEGRGLEFISAYSGDEANKSIAKHPDTVLILLDIVMEEDNSGLQVVEHIRNELGNKIIRIILRTGQPGYAPERDVIINYDINDYKEKSELTAQKLFTTVVSAIRSYSDLQTIKQRAEEKERIEGELKVAREIQASSMPQNFPLFPERNEFDIHALMSPAYEVGGDFFDIFLVDSKTLCFLIGDVSGKGVGAALFMMQCKTLLRSEAMRGSSPELTLQRVNDFLCSHATFHLFATIFIANLNLETGEMTYSNGGHNPPLLRRKKGIFETLELPRAVPLNLFSDAEYYSMQTQLSNEDIFFGYTDGVTEAQCPSEKFYSEERLIESLNTISLNNAATITSLIYDDVKRHIRDCQQSDDITIMTLRYLNQKSDS